MTITYDAYCKVTGETKPDPYSWGWKQPKTLPVANVTWWNAISYCNWMSKQLGLKPAYYRKGNLLTSTGQLTTDITQVEGYRLPTEAEWEYAARGGHVDIVDGVEANDYKYAGSNNKDEVVCSAPNPAGQKAPNELGLYNMSGNVWEKCNDYWASDYYKEGDKINPIGPDNSSYRVIRSGYVDGYTCRVAFRHSTDMDKSSRYSGFCIARTQK